MVERVIFIECSRTAWWLQEMTSCFTEQPMFRLSRMQLQHIHLLISLMGLWCWGRIFDRILSRSHSIKSCLFSLAERQAAPSVCPHVIFRGDGKRFTFRRKEQSRECSHRSLVVMNRGTLQLQAESLQMPKIHYFR